MPAIEEIVSELQEAAKNPDEKKKLAKALLDYIEAKKTDPDAPLYQFGITPTPELAKQLSEIKDSSEWEEAACEKAQAYLDEAGNVKKDKKASFKKYKEKLDAALELLERFREGKESLNSETLTVLAETYLLRSRIVRPKGITTPAKKIQAIEKGLDRINEAIKSDDTEAHRIKAQLYLELERLGKESDESLEDVLKEALNNGCTDFNNNVADVRIAALSGDTSYLDGIINSPLPDIELQKAIASRIKCDNRKLNKNIHKHIMILSRRPFSDPIWDDTVKFLVTLWNCKEIGWEKAVIRTWRVCNGVENRTRSLHIRWYWSRLRELYDLAFIAAGDDIELKATMMAS